MPLPGFLSGSGIISFSRWFLVFKAELPGACPPSVCFCGLKGALPEMSFFNLLLQKWVDFLPPQCCSLEAVPYYSALPCVGGGKPRCLLRRESCRGQMDGMLLLKKKDTCLFTKVQAMQVCCLGCGSKKSQYTGTDSHSR